MYFLKATNDFNECGSKHFLPETSANGWCWLPHFCHTAYFLVVDGKNLSIPTNPASIFGLREIFIKVGVALQPTPPEILKHQHTPNNQSYYFQNSSQKAILAATFGIVLAFGPCFNSPILCFAVVMFSPSLYIWRAVETEPVQVIWYTWPG